MESTITELLRNHRVDGVHHTHVSMIGTKGKFQFNRQGMEDLWNKYSETLLNIPDAMIGLAEKPQYYLPVLVDVDIAVCADEVGEVKETLYTPAQVEEVISVYQSILREIVEECEETDLICVLLEKPLYQKDIGGRIHLKNGFHLHFPKMFLNRVAQDTQLIPRVKDRLQELETFRTLGFENSGDVIDKASCSVPWLMYGSRKTESQEPYRLSRIYDSEMDEVDLDLAFHHYPLYNHREQLITLTDNYEKYLPRILSIIPYGRPTKEIRHGLISPLKKKLRDESGRKETHRPISAEKAIADAKVLIPMLADWRAQDYHEWMAIGWCLYNVGEGSADALDLWLEFSARCEEKFDESECLEKWDKMTKGSLSIGTIRYYASIDNPQAYSEFKKKNTSHNLEEAVQGSHNDIAKALYAQYGDEFVCASITNNVWFQFIDHKWELIEDGVFLRKKISSELVEHYIRKTQEAVRAMATATDGNEVRTNKAIKAYQKMIQNLKSATYKNNVMRECREVFYDKRFREKLDTNPYLIAFKNGVMDLKTFTFRPGRPEDFISKCMPINYVNFDESDKRVQEIYTFLEQIFPDAELRQYFLDNTSDVFIGGNHQKVVIFWTGDGDNGKSVVQTLIEQMLGPLAIKFNTTVVTGKKPQSGAANADLARAGGGVRWAVLEEPDGDEMINTGTMKHLSGNDSFFARDLFEKGKDGREIKPMFKLIFICNTLPKLKHSDAAFWNRVMVLPFETTFCRPGNPAPETYEEQLRQKRFPMDTQFSKRIPGMLEPLAWVLLNHQKNLTVRNIPDKVRAATNVYKRQNDIYRQFIDEMIVEEDDKSLALTVLFSRFKEWYKESLPNHRIPIKNEVEEYFTRAWGAPKRGKKWAGFRLRTLEEDISNGDAVVLEEGDMKEYDPSDVLPM